MNDDFEYKEDLHGDIEADDDELVKPYLDKMKLRVILYRDELSVQDFMLFDEKKAKEEYTKRYIKKNLSTFGMFCYHPDLTKKDWIKFRTNPVSLNHDAYFFSSGMSFFGWCFLCSHALKMKNYLQLKRTTLFYSIVYLPIIKIRADILMQRREKEMEELGLLDKYKIKRK